MANIERSVTSGLSPGDPNDIDLVTQEMDNIRTAGVNDNYDGQGTDTYAGAPRTDLSILGNATLIATNIADIASVTATADGNVTDIAANTGDIATNVTNIATNTAAIATLASYTKTDGSTYTVDNDSESIITFPSVIDVVLGNPNLIDAGKSFRIFGPFFPLSGVSSSSAVGTVVVKAGGGATSETININASQSLFCTVSDDGGGVHQWDIAFSQPAVHEPAIYTWAETTTGPKTFSMVNQNRYPDEITYISVSNTASTGSSTLTMWPTTISRKTEIMVKYSISQAGCTFDIKDSGGTSVPGVSRTGAEVGWMRLLSDPDNTTWRLVGQYTE